MHITYRLLLLLCHISSITLALACVRHAIAARYPRSKVRELKWARTHIIHAKGYLKHWQDTFTSQ